MKKTIFITLLMIFTLGATTTTFANDKDLKSDAPVATENKLSTEEVTRLTKRVEEIRDMDKSEMNANDRKELRKEMKEIKKNVKKNSGAVVIGGTTLLLIIILIIILL